jgi:hAT family C-terminal dimerisation region
LSKYHDITIKAAQIWKDMGHDSESCSKLLTQLRKYKKNKAPFNQKYNKSDTPIDWWESAQNKEEWELQALAIRIFAVSPHSASCERSFSVLGWFYGQRRTKLAAERIEGMCKLHTYYITNAKRELPYYAIDTSENSLREKMINTIVEISEELGDDDLDFLYDENIIDMVMDMSQTYNLNVALDVDIESHIFNMERRESENVIAVDDQSTRQTVVLAPEREDFDIEALIANEMDDN